MAIQRQSYQIAGMRQDNLVNTGNSNRFAHEIMNMRVNTNGDYTTASWTTEQGTLTKSISWVGNTPSLDGFKPLGQAVINDQWIIFGRRSVSDVDEHGVESYRYYDYILKLYYGQSPNEDTLYGAVLYPRQLSRSHDLGFSVNHPIETISYYENEKIQKVYWTDGINQPRVINVARETPYPNDWQFDFIKSVALAESPVITKSIGGSGQFPPGTVKYALTYYNKYGQESNIVWTSTLYYPTKGDRGLKEDELSGDVFKIEVNNIDTSNYWDYIRLYSIIRTTEGSTPIVRIVDNRPIGNSTSITFYDSNTTGEIIDPTILQYLGGKEIFAETFAQKDNTLFLGNLTLNTKSLKEVEAEIEAGGSSLDWNTSSAGFTLDHIKAITYADNLHDNIYPWVNQLNDTSHNPKVFKKGEYYRLGIQFQDSKGNWSDVKFLGDYLDNISPQGEISSQDEYTPVPKVFPLLQYTLLNSTREALLPYYKKARLVCCFPTNNDRSVIAQGVLCPTLVNEEWERTHTPDVISSWFYRFGAAPNPVGDEGVFDEVQSTVSEAMWNSIAYVNVKNDDDKSIIEHTVPTADLKKSWFKINRSVHTFHSPDIEFDESLRTLDWSNVKLRVVGTATRTSTSWKTYLEYSKQAEDYLGNKGKGFIDYSASHNYKADFTQIYELFGKWNDIDVYDANCIDAKGAGGQRWAWTYDFPIYPFQRKYLNNYMGELTRPVAVNNRSDIDTIIEESSIIKEKVCSRLNQSINTNFTPIKDIGLVDCQIFDSNEVIPTKLKNGLIYYGNVNSIAPIVPDLLIRIPIFEYQGLIRNNTIGDISGCGQDLDNIVNWYRGSYLLGYANEGKPGGVIHTPDGDIDVDLPLGVSSDPVPITYKSTPHVVIDTANKNLIPTGITLDSESLLVAELYRDVPADQRFGGNTEDAILHNQFVPCSLVYDLSTEGNIVMVHSEGDTYYMRYDNLKTYPFTREDINQVVEIFSFMCETRINLDGRSDKNRGLIDNTLIDNTNFNYINKSYTQKDNLFVYHTLDELSAGLSSFPNQLTWTKTKVPAEEIDTWTNITLASIADAEGTVGPINKLVNLNDSLYLFQNHGTAKIGYNERTAISTENGVPLELANSGKFTGLAYLSKDIGCQNKWSINVSKNGVFFIDDSRRELIALGENLPSLSTMNGLDAFFIQQLPEEFKAWTPDSMDNFVTYYDKLSKDVLYINKDWCLAWNEEAKTFTSFYNYEGVPYMANIGKHSLMWKGNRVYAAREGDSYSNFFGTSKPYWITLVCDGMTSDGNAFPADKVFNNIEYRADIFDMQNTLPRADINLPIFTHKAAWNGYQVYKEFAIDAIRKFNIWRVQLPRATYRDDEGNLTTTRDRIRNPFCYIKLVNNNPAESNSGHRAILHDFAVYYDMK